MTPRKFTISFAMDLATWTCGDVNPLHKAPWCLMLKRVTVLVVVTCVSQNKHTTIEKENHMHYERHGMVAGDMRRPMKVGCMNKLIMKSP